MTHYKVRKRWFLWTQDLSYILTRKRRTKYSNIEPKRILISCRKRIKFLQKITAVLFIRFHVPAVLIPTQAKRNAPYEHVLLNTLRLMQTVLFQNISLYVATANISLKWLVIFLTIYTTNADHHIISNNTKILASVKHCISNWLLFLEAVLYININIQKYQKPFPFKTMLIRYKSMYSWMYQDYCNVWIPFRDNLLFPYALWRYYCKFP